MSLEPQNKYANLLIVEKPWSYLIEGLMGFYKIPDLSKYTKNLKNSPKGIIPWMEFPYKNKSNNKK